MLQFRQYTVEATNVRIEAELPADMILYSFFFEDIADTSYVN